MKIIKEVTARFSRGEGVRVVDTRYALTEKFDELASTLVISVTSSAH